jgi:FAD synthase
MSTPAAHAAAVAAGYTELRALPVRVALAGEVVKGFGRGSKELGIPTANLDADALGDALAALPTGIYLGWASVRVPEIEGDGGSGGDGGSARVHKMVMSVGWNPFYKNERKTVEPHLLHDFGARDFYGQRLRLVLTGFMRPERGFDSLGALVDAINADIAHARALLDEEPHASARDDATLVDR